MQLAARLFAIKEKPNFDDAAARNCADALRHWMPASPASGSDNPGA
jgi:hypothetical protein